jgi:hypothetical protein
LYFWKANERDCRQNIDALLAIERILAEEEHWGSPEALSFMATGLLSASCSKGTTDRKRWKQKPTGKGYCQPAASFLRLLSFKSHWSVLGGITQEADLFGCGTCINTESSLNLTLIRSWTALHSNRF